MVPVAFSGCLRQKPVNLILFIGDGMGVARDYASMTAPGDVMTFPFFPVTGAFSITHHSVVMVPAFTFAPSSESFTGVHDNTELFHYFYTLPAPGK